MVKENRLDYLLFSFLGENMRCFWKWGHDWKAATEKQANEIREKLDIIGVFAEKIEICSKCSGIKVVASTFMDTKLRVKILPPYPFDEKT